jgi:hypothetical protein
MKKNISQFRIGVDLDNTIISYDKAFQLAAVASGLVDKHCNLNKKALRDLIRERPDGEYEWQKLQGYVYSEGINEAVLFPGVYRFLWRCKERKIDIEIVSHKTEFGHFDIKKISLRDSATNFLINHGLLDNKNPLIKKVTYKSTKKEKIDYIKQNNFDYFIDDLEEIIFSEELEGQKGILFSRDNLSVKNSNNIIAQSWEKISQRILGNLSLNEVKNMANLIGNNSKVESIEKLKGQGNSAIYKLHLSNSNESALKIYPEITYHDRLWSEFNSTKIFKELNINNVQRPISFDRNLGIATYEWIEGKRISSYGIKELNSALSFLSALNQNTKAEQFKDFSVASDACLKGADIEMQIERRLLQLEDVSSKYSDLDYFLKNNFKPLLKEIISWSKASWPSNSSYIVPIAKNELILSPSDFGFHNSLCSQNENLIFHDFEYFGWDDPVKLISDFSHNAGMSLTNEIEQLWFSGASRIYGKDLLSRLSVAWPLYGLNWCLIILNEFKDEVWIRRCSSDDSKSNLREEQLSTQLAKSKNKLNALAINYRTKHFW